MDETILLKLALAVSIIGLLALYAVSRVIEINDTTIEKIAGSSDDEQVKIKGIVEKISNSDKVTVIDVSQKNTIQVIFFNNKENFSTGKEISIAGKKQDGKIIAYSAVQGE
ncbi:MAG: hypothetical protein V1859_08395 [archaeon]